MIGFMGLAAAALPIGINLVQAGIRSGGNVDKFWNNANLFSGFGTASGPSGPMDIAGAIGTSIILGAAGYAIKSGVTHKMSQNMLAKTNAYNISLAQALHQPTTVGGSFGLPASVATSATDKLMNLYLMGSLASQASTPIRVLSDGRLRSVLG